MNRWIALFISAIVCWSGAMACKGGGAPATVAPDVDFAVSQYTAAKAALQAGDLAAAKVEYEKVLAGSGAAAKAVPAKLKTTPSLSDGNLSDALSEYEKTVAGTLNDPKANFGLGLIKLAQLGQGDVATAILDKFGQPPLKTSLVVGPDGYLAQLDKFHQTCQSKPNNDAMPFGNLPKMYVSSYNYDPASPYQGLTTFHRADRLKKFFGTLLGQAKPELTTAEIQKALLNIEPVLKEVIAEWETAEKDPNFLFTLPKELFFANADVTIKHADLSLGISALYGALSAIDLANSWTADMDLGKLIDTKGATGKIGNILIQKKDIVPILNKFFALKSDNHLGDAKTNLQKALQKGKDALGQYLTGNVGGALVVDDALTKPGIQELLTTVTEVLAAFDAPTPITATTPIATLNLGHLFANPPNADTIDIDPFVLETPYPGGNQIKAVETFFQKMMDGVIDVKLNQETFKIFTSNVKGKTFRKTLFANFINLFSDPKCEVLPLACTPKCDGKSCGDDGCGGSCGTCQAPKSVCYATEGTCNEPTMVSGSCTAKCDGKSCGDDGCGGTCGTCQAGNSCSVGGLCVPDAKQEVKLPVDPVAPTVLFPGAPNLTIKKVDVAGTQFGYALNAKSVDGVKSIVFKCTNPRLVVGLQNPLPLNSTDFSSHLSFYVKDPTIVATDCNVVVTSVKDLVTSVSFSVTLQ